jgi:predicted metal-dependent hydrolase
VRALLRQLPLPLVAPPVPDRRALSVGGRVYVVLITRHRRARRYVLRLADDQTLRLTVPRGASIAGGLRFAERQGEWIEREQVRQATKAEPWRDGTVIFFRGQLERLRVGPQDVACGDQDVRISASDRDVRAAVEAHLRALATRELPARCAELAGVHGLRVARVAVRDQRSRWGACSARRVITLNWRLVQMPAHVSDYIILHELTHLRQANHSPRFWREVERVCPDWHDAERWLRRHGREIL